MDVRFLGVCFVGAVVLLLACYREPSSAPTRIADSQPAEVSDGDLAGLAGFYLRGVRLEGEIYTLLLEPTGNFELKYRFLKGHPPRFQEAYGRVVGRFSLDGSSLELIPTSIQRADAGIPKLYQRVLWGERLYLVEAELMEAFCKSVRSGSLKKDPDLFLIRQEDLEKPVWGLPAVPPEWRARLSPSPQENGSAAEGSGR